MRIRAATRQNGITLIELIITLAIIAVGAGLATSGVSAAIHAAHTSNATSNLYAALTRARSAAANSTVDVVLCPSVDGAFCSAGYHWESGWIAFAATHTGSDRTPDEPILLRQEPLPAKLHLITSSGRKRIRFQPSGGNAGSNATFTFCDGRGAAKASAYAMANNGNLRATKPDPASVAQACANL